jgi:hypothetical protein
MASERLCISAWKLNSAIALWIPRLVKSQPARVGRLDITPAGCGHRSANTHLAGEIFQQIGGISNNVGASPHRLRAAEYPRPDCVHLHTSDTHLIRGDGSLCGAVDAAAGWASRSTSGGATGVIDTAARPISANGIDR